jgi:septal ring factor EnvC (AmiA/AmiB activator)
MKALTLVLLILAVAAAGTLGYMWYSTKQAKADMEVTLQKQIAEGKQKAQESAAEVEKLTTELAAKDSTVTQLQNDLSELKKTQLAAAEGLISEKEAEIGKLNGTIEELQTKTSGLESELQTAQDDAAAKAAEVATLRETVNEKDVRLGALEESVQDWQQKQKESADLADNYKKRLLDNKIPIEPEKQFAGNILVAYAEPEFVILSLGADDDLPAGTELKVVRGAEYVGKITVQKLLTEDGHLSYATITSLADKSKEIREGDVVKN